ncbi:MAG: hypothetical protein K8S99_01205 [Planctomycetes bacterium]|nr:hypothetical protein [Planctomycetota bacterium]
MISFECHFCDELIQMDDRHAGRRGKCPKCGTPFKVPGVREKESTDAEEIPDVSEALLTIASHVPPAGAKVNAPAPAAPVSRGQTALGFVAMVLASLSLLTGWVPHIGGIGYIFVTIAIVCGVIGVFLALSQRGAGIGLNLAGLVLAALGLALTFYVQGSIAHVIKTARESVERKQEEHHESPAPPYEAPSSTAHAQAPPPDVTPHEPPPHETPTPEMQPEPVAPAQTPPAEEVTPEPTPPPPPPPPTPKDPSQRLINVEYVGSRSVLFGDKLTFKLTNVSGRGIDSFVGHIEFFNPARKHIDEAQVTFKRRLIPGASAAVADQWILEDEVMKRLNDGTAVLKFSVENVTYTGGETEKFEQPAGKPPK